MNKLLYVAFFGLGISVGVLATRTHYKNKMQKQLNDALDKVFNSEKAEETTDEEPEPPVYVKMDSPLTEEKPDIMEYYHEKVEKSGYTNYSTDVEGDNVEKKFKQYPYVISPEAIGEMDGYSVISLTLFSDGVLADDDFEPMEQDEIVDCIGEDYQDHFGDFEDDAVHIRNDIHRTDYEILRDLRPYDEVAKIKPRKVRLNE